MLTPTYEQQTDGTVTGPPHVVAIEDELHA